jgi:hypothetical protein
MRVTIYFVIEDFGGRRILKMVDENRVSGQNIYNYERLELGGLVPDNDLLMVLYEIWFADGHRISVTHGHYFEKGLLKTPVLK